MTSYVSVIPIVLDGKSFLIVDGVVKHSDGTLANGREVRNLIAAGLIASSAATNANIVAPPEDAFNGGSITETLTIAVADTDPSTLDGTANLVLNTIDRMLRLTETGLSIWHYDGEGSYLEQFDFYASQLNFRADLDMFGTAKIADEDFNRYRVYPARADTTGSRPTLPNSSFWPAGRMYFDTTLNQPIYVNAVGSDWVDSAGATV